MMGLSGENRMQPGALGKVYQDGETVIRQGQVGEYLYIIQEGKVEVVLEENGQLVRLAVREAGQPLGELEVFGNQSSLATVRALGQARILTVDKKAFLRRIQQDPSLAFFMLEAMSARVRELSTTVAYLEQHQPDVAATENISSNSKSPKIAVLAGRGRSTSDFELKPVRQLNKTSIHQTGRKLVLGKHLAGLLRSVVQTCLLAYLL